MIRLVCKPLLKGRPFVATDHIEIMPTDRTDVGIHEISSQTHIAFEAICNPEEQEAIEARMLNQMQCIAKHWERHYQAVSNALTPQF